MNQFYLPTFTKSKAIKNIKLIVQAAFSFLLSGRLVSGASCLLKLPNFIIVCLLFFICAGLFIREVHCFYWT